VLKLSLYVADWSMFLHYHSTNARTNQPTKKQTEKPAQGAETFVKKTSRLASQEMAGISGTRV
jgi:hypothetical protein